MASDSYQVYQQVIKAEIYNKVGTNASTDFLKGLKSACTLPEKLVEEFKNAKKRKIHKELNIMIRNFNLSIINRQFRKE